MADTTKTKKKRRWLRRLAIALIAFPVLLFLASPWLIDLLGGHTERRALDDPDDLSPEARALLDRVLEDLDPDVPLVDYHTHLAGQGNGTDCWIHPHMRSLLHPKAWVRYQVYLSAAGVSGSKAEDGEFVDELVKLARARPRPMRHMLLAFDHRYREDGTRDLERSEFYVPNEYVWETAAAHPDVFSPCISVHPYRKDAVSELVSWAERGVKQVKWLPNAQGIDPANELCDPFYAALVEHDMVLLTHAGLESAVEAGEDQALGNPLRLRRPLDAGVRVIVAHCASSGTGEDLDRPGGPEVSNFELFLRLMDEERYEGRLFGEISTTTQVNRFENGLAELLRRTDLHPRLVNGSDWPLPAINSLYQTRALVEAGFLTADERTLLNELYHYNPLVFDLALKRTVKAPGTAERFAPVVFHGREELGW